MKRLPLDATDEDILATVDEWVDLLAGERYGDAHDFLYHSSGDHLTPTLLEHLIHNYGNPPVTEAERLRLAQQMSERVGKPPEFWLERLGRPLDTVYRVTPRDQASPSGPRSPEAEVFRVDEPSEADSMVVARVDYDLPLNGEWSDLTAQFQVERVDDTLVLVLQDLHVL